MPAVISVRSTFILVLILSMTISVNADWPSWRGPHQNGVSDATKLIDQWTPDGENLIWQADFIGRSTPIALNGRIYAIGRTGKDISEQERVTCFDAKTGEKIWEHRFNVFHTTIPFNRIGWASLVGDPVTGHIYAHGVQGMFFCFDKKEGPGIGASVMHTGFDHPNTPKDAADRVSLECRSIAIFDE